MAKRVLLGTLGLVVFVMLFRFTTEARNSRTTIARLGVTEGLLYRCSEKPNCVSSDAADEEHSIAPIADESGTAWQRLSAVLSEFEGVRLETNDDGYVHATFASSLFGFVDDVEFHRRGDQIAMRSASRVGYSDLGANRRRLEAIRGRLDTP